MCPTGECVSRWGEILKIRDFLGIMLERKEFMRVETESNAINMKNI